MNQIIIEPTSLKNTCQICFMPADGIHFNVVSCRACAAFFRRTIAQNLDYKCRTGFSACDINKGFL
ncbi:unnamed protein product [Dracunculus medinensis]|uniref:Nuclear receptor domain-containing protein n=1 Tax=Dracunculus medinensis TaxID=318479 RepID=A0A0N4UFF1_DRAME|nr:unnamed protein product [Dracunculus medinensis]